MRIALLTLSSLLAVALSLGAPELALAQTPAVGSDGAAPDAPAEETAADAPVPSDGGLEEPLAASAELSEPAIIEPETPTAQTVLLMAPASVRAEWTAALQVELASRGVLVVPMDAPDGPTVLIRSAEAQRALLERGGASAILVIEGDAAFSLHVMTPDSAAARTAPVSAEADPRTAALIAVSLWDEQPLPAAPPAPAAQPRPMPAWAQTPTPPDFLHEEPPERPGEEVHVSARFGTGGFGFFGSQQSLPGSLIRGGLGIRFGLFEMDALGDAGLMLDRVNGFGDEFQPLIRFALSVGLMGTVDIVGLHGGLRASVGYAEARDPIASPPFLDPFNPDGDFVFDQGGFMGGIGGYFAVSFLLQDAMRLFIRADIEASQLVALVEGLVFSPTLSVMLAVE